LGETNVLLRFLPQAVILRFSIKEVVKLTLDPSSSALNPSRRLFFTYALTFAAKRRTI